MDSTIIGAIAGILVALVAYYGGRTLNKANATAVDVKTLSDLVDKVEKQHEEIMKLRNEIDAINDKLEKLESNNRALWKYIYALVEFIRKHGLIPPAPPRELESDPKLMELLK